MKITIKGIRGFELNPENELESELLELWALGGVREFLGGISSEDHNLKIYFGIKKGLYEQRKNKEILQGLKEGDLKDD